MKKTLLMLLLAAAPVCAQAQRLLESTNRSWEHPNLSVETYKNIVFSGFTDIEPNTGQLLPVFKLNDVSGSPIISFYTDFGTDVKLMDFTIRENAQTIVLAGYTTNFPYLLVMAEVDWNGNMIQSAMHASAFTYGLIPHQVIISENAQQAVVAGVTVDFQLTGTNGSSVGKTAYVMGMDLNNLSITQFTAEEDTPAGGFTDNDMYENITEIPGGYFISGSANDPSSAEQLLAVLGIDYNGVQLHSTIWDNSNSRYMGSSVLYSQANNVVYLLANNSVVHQFEIGAFDPYTGTLINGMHHHQIAVLPIGGGVDQNGFRLQENAHNDVIVAGYLTCWNQNPLPNLITPYQMTLDASLTSAFLPKLFQSDDNYDLGDYFSMIGNSVYVNTPDMMVYNRDFDRTYIVTPNSDQKGYDLDISPANDYTQCEEPLSTIHFVTTPGSFSWMVGPFPEYSFGWSESPIHRGIQQHTLCGGKSMTAAGQPAATLFPNPASDNLTVTVEEAVTGMKLIDLNGAVIRVFGALDAQSDRTIAIGDLKSGVYILEMEYASGTTERQKFVRE